MGRELDELGWIRKTLQPISSLADASLGENSQFSISSSIRDDQVHVVVTALTKDDEYLNFLDIQATAIDPDLNPIPLRLRQSPGRYVGTFPIAKTGSYFVNVIPGTGNAPLSTGISVPYSARVSNTRVQFGIDEFSS